MKIGSEMAALQEKTPKMDPKKWFFWKIHQDFELLKKVPQNIHQTGHFGWNRYIGTWNLSHGAFQGSVLMNRVHFRGWGCRRKFEKSIKFFFINHVYFMCVSVPYKTTKTSFRIDKLLTVHVLILLLGNHRLTTWWPLFESSSIVESVSGPLKG